MSKYRRKTQISNEEIDQFKDIEINKINSQLSASPIKRTKRKLAIANLSLITLIVFVGFFIFMNPNDSSNDQTPPNNTIDESYAFIQLSNSTYLLEAKESDFDFKFIYNADIVMHGERTSFNDTFDYNLPFIYADQDIKDRITIDLEVFKYSQFIYYLETVVNGQATYLEVNYFKNHRNPSTLDALTIINMEEDFNQLHALLETYPPIEIVKDAIYEPHPDALLLDDSRAKENYLAYVEHYYTSENAFTDKNDGGAKPNLVMQRHQVIVDETGAILDTGFLTGFSFGSIDPAIDIFLQHNHNTYFSFIPVGEERAASVTSVDYSLDTHNVLGWLSTQEYNESLYIYSSVYLDNSQVDLSNTSYVTIDYLLGDTFDNISGNFTSKPFFFNRALIIPPLELPIQKDDYVAFYDIFTSIEIKFYNENDELIHELNITRP